MAEGDRSIHAYPGIGEAIRDAVERAFPEREFVVWRDPEEFETGISGVEHLLALRPPRGRWREAGRLRFIQMPGAGVDSLLPAPDLRGDVRIANCRGVHEPEMSEFVLALVMAISKRLPQAFAQQRRREWKPFATRALSGQTIGVLGLGAIGLGFASRCKALGMRVIGTRRSGAAPQDSSPPEVDAVFGPDGTARVLAEADVVVVVLPKTPETENLIDADAIASMKPGARIVNVARGGIVDEAALARALEERRLAGAAFDVFSEEPLSQESPLWDAPNMLITPHVAGLFPTYMERVGGIFIDNIRRLEGGQPLVNEIDRERGY